MKDRLLADTYRRIHQQTVQYRKPETPILSPEKGTSTDLEHDVHSQEARRLGHNSLDDASHFLLCLRLGIQRQEGVRPGAHEAKQTIRHNHIHPMKSTVNTQQTHKQDRRRGQTHTHTHNQPLALTSRFWHGQGGHQNLRMAVGRARLQREASATDP